MVHSFGGHTEQDIKCVPGNLFHTVKYINNNIPQISRINHSQGYYTFIGPLSSVTE